MASFDIILHRNEIWGFFVGKEWGKSVTICQETRLGGVFLVNFTLKGLVAFM